MKFLLPILAVVVVIVVGFWLFVIVSSIVFGIFSWLFTKPCPQCGSKERESTEEPTGESRVRTIYYTDYGARGNPIGYTETPDSYRVVEDEYLVTTTCKKCGHFIKKTTTWKKRQEEH